MQYKIHKERVVHDGIMLLFAFFKWFHQNTRGLISHVFPIQIIHRVRTIMPQESIDLPTQFSFGNAISDAAVRGLPASLPQNGARKADQRFGLPG